MLSREELRRAARDCGGVDRRLFLAVAAGLAALPKRDRAARADTTAAPPRGDDPFLLGVASGDPSAGSVVLWTRLAPRPLEPGGGMPPAPVEVVWEIAEDEQFARIAARGHALATPQLGHSVHVVAAGLAPDRWYFYRFRAGDAESPVGRTRTLPRRGDATQRFRFAFASCQHYEAGHYTAYAHMAQQNLDLVVHLGDYIYEGPGQPGKIRQHVGGELRTLDDYRARHAQYRLDPLLRGMHGVCPWAVTWDDHELDNNYAAATSEEQGVDPVDFLIRRANAYQAYYEAMPLRPRSLPQGPDMRLYRRFSIGRLAELCVLDTRQYRSDQPNDDRKSPLNQACWDPRASLLGRAQRGWLQRTLTTSPATWNVLAQQVMMGVVDRKSGPPEEFSMDQWSGYLHERRALLDFLATRRVANPVVLTGDIHSNWVNDLRSDDRKFDAPAIATEFVGTSISSGGNAAPVPPEVEKLLAENPQVRFHTQQRGYVACELTPGEWRSDYVAVEEVARPGGKVATAATFVVEAGRPGAERA